MYGNVDVITHSYVYSQKFLFNLPDLNESEYQIPRRSSIAYANENFSIGYFKGQKLWGKSLSGNFIYDSHLVYETLTMKVYGKDMAFDYTFMFPEHYALGSQFRETEMRARRMFISHRLDWYATSNFTLTLSENCMYQYKNSLEIPLINPAYMYHNNINSFQFNALAHVELEYVPSAGLRTYIQIGIDQGSIPGFEDSSEEDQAMGLVAGVEYVTALYGGMLDVNVEGSVVSPAMYRREVDPCFIMYSAVGVNVPYAMYPMFTYIGYRYGGDAVTAIADVNYSKGQTSVSVNVMMLLKGSFGMFDRYYQPLGKKVLEGGATGTYRLSLDVQQGFSVMSQSIKVFCNVAGIYNGNLEAWDIQVCVGAATKLGLSRNR